MPAIRLRNGMTSSGKGLPRRHTKSTLRIGMIASIILGLGALGALLAYYDIGSVGRTVWNAGWGLAYVTLFHLVQTWFSAAAWRSVMPYHDRQPVLRFVWLRWIREGVNALLPVAQIGGEVVGARLLAHRGVRLAVAGASVTIDLTVEMITQILFTILGLALLITYADDHQIIEWTVIGIVIAASTAFGFVMAQRLGLLRLVEKLLLAMARKWQWLGAAEAAGLHDAVLAMYRRRGALLRAGWHHSLSWLLGGAEVWLALYYLGHTVDLAQALVIESLGQALKSVGFFVPGALAVQEGGYIVVLSLFGLPPELALALSLVKRFREVVLGLPALAAWQWSESRRYLNGAAAAQPATARTAAISELGGSS